MNLLKPYYCPVLSDLSGVGGPSPPEVVHAACSVGRASAVHAPPLVAAEVKDGLSDPEPGLLQGRLKNSESLVNLHVLLSHLLELQIVSCFV